ncbi:MAG: DUF72 domain-containing protein [Chitinophagaceae bacterium]|nr:DUF72 domain-containing protein [Chitinophagaceae bacterium]
MKGPVHIGTSGWHYKHWRGNFYPADIKDADRFGFYTAKFQTVELNNSFYHLPTAATFSQWRLSTPPGFLFAVKGSRFFTHMKKLNLDKEAIRPFFSNVSKLKEKLGPILFQLPPNWKLNLERLEAFLKLLPKRYRYTIEFRNHSWYIPAVYELLERHNIAFCIYDLAGHQSPLEVTADFIYIRLHGPGNKYQGSYSDAALEQWAAFCKQWRKKGKGIYVYFDNDQEGYAAFNALRLQQLLGRSS